MTAPDLSPRLNPPPPQESRRFLHNGSGARRANPRLYYLREEQGRKEVDLLIETASGQLIGIEIKASATVTTSDARHLAWLRDQTGDAFAAGIVLHAGPHVSLSVTAS